MCLDRIASRGPSPRQHTNRPSFCIAILVIALTGCSTNPGVQEDEATTDLRQIARAYEAVVVQSQRPPKDVEQVKSAVADLHAVGLVGDPAEVLVSSRDGMPYVIVPGADLGSATGKEILAYEQKGFEGQRYALLMSRDVRLISDEEFRNAKFAMGHVPAAN